MSRISGCLLALGLVAGGWPVGAPAQTLPCGARDRVLSLVLDQLGERRLATGAAQRGARVDLFAGEGGSWTLILHLPDGRACLLAHGSEFEATRGLPPALGNPA